MAPKPAIADGRAWRLLAATYGERVFRVLLYIRQGRGLTLRPAIARAARDIRRDTR